MKYVTLFKSNKLKREDRWAPQKLAKMLRPTFRASAIKWFVIFIFPFHSSLAWTSSIAWTEPHPYVFRIPSRFFNSIRDQKLEIFLKEVVNFLKFNKTMRKKSAKKEKEKVEGVKPTARWALSGSEASMTGGTSLSKE